MLNIVAYIFGSLAIGFIAETFLFSLTYGLANHFVLLPYRIFGFSGYGIPEPPFAQLVVVLLLSAPYIATTLLLAYLLRSYQARQFIVAIVIANICTSFLQMLLFSDPNRIMNIFEQKVYLIQLFLPLAPILLLLSLFARWSLTRKSL